VLEAVGCGNANTERAADRYLLDPLDQLKVEKDARARGLDVVGYYHSHPDHPSRASATDLAQSWEGLLYLILAVQGGKPAGLQGWWRDPGQVDLSEVAVQIVD
jgi:proteasome lid subunit RPN8/RPN11